jgi:hypothetical protein
MLIYLFVNMKLEIAENPGQALGTNTGPGLRNPHRVLSPIRLHGSAGRSPNVQRAPEKCMRLPQRSTMSVPFPIRLLRDLELKPL